MEKASQSADVARAGGVIDDAGEHKERPFVECVGQDANDDGGVGVFVIKREQKDEDAKLADGGVGQNFLEIVVAQCADRAEQHGDAAND